jgi:hypothetical protein
VAAVTDDRHARKVHMKLKGKKTAPVHELSSPPFPYQMILTGSVFARAGAHLFIDYQGGKVYVKSPR